MTEKRMVRYEFDWKVNTENGDCTARVKRIVFDNFLRAPVEESKFQVQVSKYVFRVFPWPGQETFKVLPNNERERFVSVAKAFYAGANKEKDFYYWELPEEMTNVIPTATTEVYDTKIRVKKVKPRKKRGPNSIWQKTT